MSSNVAGILASVIGTAITGVAPKEGSKKPATDQKKKEEAAATGQKEEEKKEVAAKNKVTEAIEAGLANRAAVNQAIPQGGQPMPMGVPGAVGAGGTKGKSGSLFGDSGKKNTKPTTSSNNNGPTGPSSTSRPVENWTNGTKAKVLTLDSSTELGKALSQGLEKGEGAIIIGSRHGRKTANGGETEGCVLCSRVAASLGVDNSKENYNQIQEINTKDGMKAMVIDYDKKDNPRLVPELPSVLYAYKDNDGNVQVTKIGHGSMSKDQILKAAKQAREDFVQGKTPVEKPDVKVKSPTSSAGFYDSPEVVNDAVASQKLILGSDENLALRQKEMLDYIAEDSFGLAKAAKQGAFRGASLKNVTSAVAKGDERYNDTLAQMQNFQEGFVQAMTGNDFHGTGMPDKYHDKEKGTVGINRNMAALGDPDEPPISPEQNAARAAANLLSVHWCSHGLCSGKGLHSGQQKASYTSPQAMLELAAKVYNARNTDQFDYLERGERLAYKIDTSGPNAKIAPENASGEDQAEAVADKVKEVLKVEKDEEPVKPE